MGPGVVGQLLRILRWIRRVDAHRLTVALDDIVERSQPRRLGRPLPPPHQAGIAHGAIQPGLERARLADASDVAIRLDQRLLHRVLAVVGMAAHSGAESPGDFLGPRQQSLERRRVTRRRRADEIRVLVGRRAV
jgi:hypothetical protein